MSRNAVLKIFLFVGLVLCSTVNRAVELPGGSVSEPDTFAEPDTSAVHELTIYVIQSYSPINWKSPSSLYRSSVESYTKSLFKKNAYSIGHLFIEFSTPLLDSVVITSIRSASGAEKRRLVMKDKIGLGLLGAVMQGRMESREELKKGLRFITYRINDESALRVIEFLEKFTKKSDGQNAPCDFYSGAFWSRYENEGGGCTSFGLSDMEGSTIITTKSKEIQSSVQISGTMEMDRKM